MYLRIHGRQLERDLSATSCSGKEIEIFAAAAAAVVEFFASIISGSGGLSGGSAGGAGGLSYRLCVVRIVVLSNKNFVMLFFLSFFYFCVQFVDSLLVFSIVCVFVTVFLRIYIYVVDWYDFGSCVRLFCFACWFGCACCVIDFITVQSERGGLLESQQNAALVFVSIGWTTRWKKNFLCTGTVPAKSRASSSA